MRTDGQTSGETDMTKLKIAFRNFAKGAQKLNHPSKYCVVSFDITTDIAFKSTLLLCEESQNFWTS
jgi:hypothetical protein